MKNITKACISLLFFCSSIGFAQQLPPVMEATPTPPSEVLSIQENKISFSAINASKYVTNVKDLALISSLREKCSIEMTTTLTSAHVNVVDIQSSTTIPVVDELPPAILNNSLLNLLRIPVVTNEYKVYINYVLGTKNGQQLLKTFSCSILETSDKNLHVYSNDLSAN